MSKLSEDIVKSIYSSEGTYKDVAKKFGVSPSCVSHIKTGERHSEITGASDFSNKRKRIPSIDKSKASIISQYIKNEENPHTQREAAEFFGIPAYTVRRVMKDYVKKFKIK